MKRNILFLMLLSATIVRGQSGAEKQVAAAVESLHNALVALDSNSLKKLTADNLSFGHSSGKVEDQAAFVSNAVNGPIKFLSIASNDQTITLAKRTAIVRYELVGKATNNGTPADLKLGVLQVWQKRKGGWKLLARQAVKI
jgi:ketosteroid isomerase-like protein